MRDKNLQYLKFCDQIEVFLKKKCYTIKILREPVVDSPTFLADLYYLKFSKNKLSTLRGLAVLSYFVPENLGWKLRFALEEKAKRLNPKDRLKLMLLLYNKEVTLAYLYETNEFSSHEVFGNLLGEGLQELRNIKICQRSSKVKKPKRKRGYHDKGSRRSFDRWLPSEDFTLSELQNKNEKKLNIYTRTLHFLEKYLREKDFLLREESRGNVE